MNPRSFCRSSDDDQHHRTAIPNPAFFLDKLAVGNHHGSPAQMKSLDLTNDPHHTQLGPQRTPSQLPSSLPVFSNASSPLSSRLSFQTITNFIPLSWASRSATSDIAPTSSTAPSMAIHSAASSVSDDTIVAPLKAGGVGFVSREKQLRKLKARMELEGVVAMKSLVHVQCKKCNGELVFI